MGVDDLIEEAKVRTVWWALCIFAISYFLTRKHAPSLSPSPSICDLEISASRNRLDIMVRLRNWDEVPCRLMTYRWNMH